MIMKILTVAAFATFEMYVAIGMGFGFKLDTWVIFFATLIGGLIGVFAAAYLGDKIKTFTNKYRKPAPEKPKTGLIYTIWNKYGILGLGIIGTFFFGAPISIGVGVGFNVPPQKLVPLCCLAVLLRCIVFTLIPHYGLKLIG